MPNQFERENLSCSEAKATLAEIKLLTVEFEGVLEKAIKTGQPERAKELRSGLESRMRELRDGLVSPVERKLEIKRQYESRQQILENVGILERLTSGELGIRGIDGKEYPMPSYQEMRSSIREKRDILEKKAEQGFTELLIVPFGMKLDGLIEKYKQLLLKHHADNKLFATKGKDSDPDEPLELDAATPVWVWDEYKNADMSGELLYDPKEFSQSHGGKTKSESLAAGGSAWRVILIEADPNIPRAGKGKSIGGRVRLEANKTPNEYLEMIGKDEYQNESGTTPEEWLMQAITTLEEKNQVIDDYRGKGSVAYNTGAYFPASGSVPNAYWILDDRQADLGGSDPTDRNDDLGARSAVRVY